MINSPASCRVLAQAERTARLAQDLGQALGTLRAAQLDCETCDLRALCQAPGWNTALDTAIRDIAGEWGLI